MTVRPNLHKTQMDSLSTTSEPIWLDFKLGLQTWEKQDDGIVTYTGGVCHPTHPTRDEIRLEDVAGQLSRICRFTGAVSEFYSVAQHCVLVSKLLPFEYKLIGLMHDTAEAYMGDIAKPWKSQLTNYKEIEDQLLNTIFKALELPYTADLPPIVKQADWMALAWEQKRFMPETDYWPHMLSDGDLKRLERRYGGLIALEPEKARVAFLETYKGLREVMAI